MIKIPINLASLFQSLPEGMIEGLKKGEITEDLLGGDFFQLIMLFLGNPNPADLPEPKDQDPDGQDPKFTKIELLPQKDEKKDIGIDEKGSQENKLDEKSFKETDIAISDDTIFPQTINLIQIIQKANKPEKIDQKSNDKTEITTIINKTNIETKIDHKNDKELTIIDIDKGYSKTNYKKTNNLQANIIPEHIKQKENKENIKTIQQNIGFEEKNRIEDRKISNQSFFSSNMEKIKEKTDINIENLNATKKANKENKKTKINQHQKEEIFYTNNEKKNSKVEKNKFFVKKSNENLELKQREKVIHLKTEHQNEISKDLKIENKSTAKTEQTKKKNNIENKIEWQKIVNQNNEPEKTEVKEIKNIENMERKTNKENEIKVISSDQYQKKFIETKEKTKNKNQSKYNTTQTDNLKHQNNLEKIQPSKIEQQTERIIPKEIPELIKNLAIKLHPEGKHEALIKLHPPDLGEMHLSVSVDKGEVKLLLTVEHPRAAETIQQHLKQLELSLQQIGLQLGDAQINYSGQNMNSFYKQKTQENLKLSKINKKEEININSQAKKTERYMTDRIIDIKV